MQESTLKDLQQTRNEFQDPLTIIPISRFFNRSMKSEISSNVWTKIINQHYSEYGIVFFETKNY